MIYYYYLYLFFRGRWTSSAYGEIEKSNLRSSESRSENGEQKQCGQDSSARDEWEEKHQVSSETVVVWCKPGRTGRQREHTTALCCTYSQVY